MEDYNYHQEGNETATDGEIHVVKPTDGVPGALHCWSLSIL